MYFVYLIRFILLFLYRKALCYYCDFLNWLHFRLTSRKSTEDNLREMVLEQVRYRHRKTEQKCYMLWCTLIDISVLKLGIKILNPINAPEDIRHSAKDFENE